VTTVLLVRHGLTRMTGPVLAGWTPDVHLDERGQEQARLLGERLAPVPVAAVVTSPLERCRETAAALGRDETAVDERVGEARYGDWTGQELKQLAKNPLWRVVQAHPSAAAFPGGEALRDTQARAVTAVRDWNGRLGPDATYAVVSHGDVIKAVLADALGMHLDLFQRLVVDPCSVSVVRYTELRPFVVRMNDVGGSVADLVPPKRRRRRRLSSDAPVGGGAGAGA
jgi:probable phosphomutase (TIGR03848 family)